MKYLIIFFLAIILSGCSKYEDPVSTEGEEPFQGLFLFNGEGIYDSVASSGGYKRRLGTFNLNGNYDSICFKFALKTNYSKSRVTFKSDSIALFQINFTNFIGDSNYHNYSYNIHKASNDIAYTDIIFVTEFRKYIVLRDLKIYLK